MPCAPSPPRTFCQEKVTTSSLCEIKLLREGGRGGVADGQALAVGRDPVAVRHAHARRGAVPGEDHVAVEVDLGQVRQIAVASLELADIGELQLLDHIGDPAGAEAFPGNHVDAALAEQRPQRHLDSTCIRRRHDADAVACRDLKDFARQLDRLFELCLADLGAMGAAERGIPQRLDRPAGTFCAGT